MREPFLSFLGHLPEAADEVCDNALALVKKNEGFMTPGQVQFVARAGNFKKDGYRYTGALRILKVLMSYDYLWTNIRVKGGGYAAHAFCAGIAFSERLLLRDHSRRYPAGAR